MRGPQLPTALEHLGRRPFCFYPAIAGIEHNEWMLLRSSWDEITVSNTRTRTELVVPRRLLGGVSSSEDPFVIVGLTKELEIREGMAVPRVQRVIEMPRAGGDGGIRAFRHVAPEPGHVARVVGIRTESPVETKSKKTLVGAVALSLAVCVLGLAIFRESPLVAGSRLFAMARPAPPFTANDDYISVVGKWGHPSSTRSKADLYFLLYPDRGYTLLLSGSDRDRAKYLGSVSWAGRFRSAAAK